MSQSMDEDIRRRSARRKTAPVPEIIQGKTTETGASRDVSRPDFSGPRHRLADDRQAGGNG